MQKELLTEVGCGPRVKQGGPFALRPVMVVFQLTDSLGR